MLRNWCFDSFGYIASICMAIHCHRYWDWWKIDIVMWV